MLAMSDHIRASFTWKYIARDCQLSSEEGCLSIEGDENLHHLAHGGGLTKINGEVSLLIEFRTRGHRGNVLYGFMIDNNAPKMIDGLTLTDGDCGTYIRGIVDLKNGFIGMIGVLQTKLQVWRLASDRFVVMN